MSRNLWLFDNGHGGIINGVNQTPSRQFKMKNGEIFCEGEFNRAIVAKLAEKCALNGIRFALITPECVDIPLRERVRRANEWYVVEKNCILISVHSNKGRGSGFEIFTSPGETKSDKVATIFYRNFDVFHRYDNPPVKMRKDTSDGDVDKEANFTILTKTAMPAVLPESFFYDNEDDYRRYLRDHESRDNIAEAYFRAILEIEEKAL
jgi:N-acetylmuramoyl-L-alanine amidase